MIQLTGSEISQMYFAVIDLASSGIPLQDAKASMGILQGSKLDSIMSGDITPFINFPDSKVTI